MGTLLKRALNPTERHALGAHYTPRAYVERLVLPTVVEPLRAEWANAQAAALVLAHQAADLDGKPAQAKLAEARAQVKAFHHRLCSVRVLRVNLFSSPSFPRRRESRKHQIPCHPREGGGCAGMTANQWLSGRTNLPCARARPSLRQRQLFRM